MWDIFWPKNELLTGLEMFALNYGEKTRIQQPKPDREITRFSQPKSADNHVFTNNKRC